MTCEEFQMADLDGGLTAEEGPLQQAARQHLLECPHCAALHENWQVLRTDLHALAQKLGKLKRPLAWNCAFGRNFASNTRP